MKTETRTRYEPIELPQGWRFLRNEIDAEGHWALITDAPERLKIFNKDHNYHNYQYKWVRRIPYIETRTVSDWTRSPSGPLGTV